jgi:small subunit ribosomal protein S9
MKAAWRPVGLGQSIRSSCRAAIVAPSTVPIRQALLAASKSFSTSSKSGADAVPNAAAPSITAAPEIDFDQFRLHVRSVPVSPSYFTAKPSFTDNVLFLQTLLARYQSLPTVKPGEASRVAWRTLVDYRTRIGEDVKASKYHKIIDVLHRLNHIHPSVMPAEVKDAINAYKRDVDPFSNVAKPIPIDRFGRALGVGRRKSSTARAWVVEGEGEVLINGKPLTDAFARVHDRESAIWALKATDRVDKYNVWALVEGGGTTGQAEALALAVGKALMAHEPLLKPALRRGEQYMSMRWLLLVNFTMERLQADFDDSGLRNKRSEKGREKEAGTPESQEEACVGPQIVSLCIYCIILGNSMASSALLSKNNKTRRKVMCFLPEDTAKLSHRFASATIQFPMNPILCSPFLDQVTRSSRTASSGRSRGLWRPQVEDHSNKLARRDCPTRSEAVASINGEKLRYGYRVSPTV